MTNPIHPAGHIEIITTEPVIYLMIDGQGAPDAFIELAAKLRAAAKTISDEIRPLEALWWTASGEVQSPERPDDWRWTIMIALPDSAEVKAPLPDGVRVDTLEEGQTIQRLYIGSLRNKDSELKEMLDQAKKQGYEPAGKYHEIYLDDPGPDSPPDAHTLLRQPIKRSHP